MPGSLFRFSTLALFAWLGTACVVLQPSGSPLSDASTPTTASGGPCQISIVDNSFSGYCGDIEVVNSGTYPMEAWQVDFDLPSGTSLISSWNGNFKVTDGHVVVTSLEPNTPMPSQGEIELGYCASGQATNVAVIPGNCFAPDANSTSLKASTSLNAALSTNFEALDSNVWRVVAPNVGYTTPCAATPRGLTFNDTGLGIGVCGGIQYTSPVLFGAMSAEIRATSVPGTVTQLMTVITLPNGLQGVALAIAGSNPNMLVMTVWRDNTPTLQTADMGFDASAALHTYDMTWQQNGVTWSVDGKTLGQTSTLPESIPEYLTLSLWSATGTPAWAGALDPNAATPPANVASLVFAPVVAFE